MSKPRRGRPPQLDSLTVVRMIRMSPAMAEAHDAAYKADGRASWVEWIRAAAELAIARGGTR